jgi:hypothetical protein
MLRDRRTVTLWLATSLARCMVGLSAGAALALCLGSARAADPAGSPFDPSISPRTSAFVHGRHRPRHRIVYRAPVIGPPVQSFHVWGYLPRNHNIPMYNEPPRRGPVW